MWDDAQKARESHEGFSSWFEMWHRDASIS